MAYGSSHTAIINTVDSEQLTLMRKFGKAASLPEYLTSYNDALVQRAYFSVAQENWSFKIEGLVHALKFNANLSAVRGLLAQRSLNNLTRNAEALLDMAFLAKYTELTDKVKFDFDNFFPYEIHTFNQKYFVFKKLQQSDLLHYILTMNR